MDLHCLDLCHCPSPQSSYQKLDPCAYMYVCMYVYAVRHAYVRASLRVCIRTHAKHAQTNIQTHAHTCRNTMRYVQMLLFFSVLNFWTQKNVFYVRFPSCMWLSTRNVPWPTTVILRQSWFAGTVFGAEMSLYTCMFVCWCVWVPNAAWVQKETSTTSTWSMCTYTT